MSLADNTAIPSPPTTYAVYRGFYVLPGDIPLPSGCVRVDFFVARSTDNLTWENWGLLGSGEASVGFYAVHTGLDENTYYAYYVQYVFRDGSKSAIGQTATPGQAELIITPSLNIDQLASQAYSTGLVTSGTFRGVVFETSATDPKVRMDPSGIFATNAFKPATPTFYLNAYDGSLTLTGPIVSGGSITGGTINIGNGTFTVDAAGNMTALSATIDGGGTFTGTLSAATGTFSGTVSASTITGSTITSSLFQSSASNPRTGFDSTGFWVTDSGGTKRITINTSGINLPAHSAVLGSPASSIITWGGGAFTIEGDSSLGILTCGGASLAISGGINPSIGVTTGGASVTILTDAGVSGFLQSANNLSELSTTGSGNVIVKSDSPHIIGQAIINSVVCSSAFSLGGFTGQGPQGPTGFNTPSTVGSTNAVFRNTAYPGSFGSTAYTVGDLVSALKTFGFLNA